MITLPRRGVAAVFPALALLFLGAVDRGSAQAPADLVTDRPDHYGFLGLSVRFPR